MELKEIQNAVDKWISQWEEGYWSPLSNLARLSEEVGELARVVNHLHGEKTKKKIEEVGSIEEELGDILFVIVSIANSLDIDLESAFEKTLKKYDVRDADRFQRKESKK